MISSKTEQKPTYEELEQKIKDLESMQIESRMKSFKDLTKIITHDFNNILSGAVGYSKMLSNEDLSEKQIYFLKKISRSHQEIINIINIYSNIASGFIPYPKITDIYPIIKDSFLKLEKENDLDDKITKKINFDLSEFKAYADKIQLKKIFTNIGQNSIDSILQKESKQGTITINARYHNFKKTDKKIIDTPKKYIHISFEDNGIGMTEKEKKNVFNPGYSTSNNYTKRCRGFGLSIAYYMIKNNHGNIKIESSKEKGTKVHIYLPSVPLTENKI